MTLVEQIKESLQAVQGISEAKKDVYEFTIAKKDYRATLTDKKFPDAMVSYTFEWNAGEKYGWRPLKNLDMRTKIMGLIRKELPEAFSGKLMRKTEVYVRGDYVSSSQQFSSPKATKEDWLRKYHEKSQAGEKLRTRFPDLTDKEVKAFYA